MTERCEATPPTKPRLPRAPPDPILTEDNAVFWDAAAVGRLVAQRCGNCGVLRHPPRPMCGHCRSLAIDVVELSGRGTLYSYSVLHHPRHPAFDYPLLTALVELDEGIRVVTNLIDIEAADVRIDMPLQVTFAPTVGGRQVPVFRPASTSEPLQ